MSEILNCNVRESHFRKDLFGIFEILEHPLLSKHSQSVVQSGSRLYRAILIKGNSTTYIFLTKFQSFRCIYIFQNTLIKLSVTEFSRVLNCTTIVLFYIKKWLHQRQFLEISWGEIIPTKKSVMGFYFGSNLQYL